VVVHPGLLQLVPQKQRLDGVKGTGEVEEHDSHSVSRLFQVREASLQQEDDGLVGITEST